MRPILSIAISLLCALAAPAAGGESHIPKGGDRLQSSEVDENQVKTTSERKPDKEAWRDSVQLKEVTVVAQSYKDVIPAQVLGGKELESLQSHSVADALRYFSGVQLKDYGGVGGVKTVNIRSMGTNHAGVYYNGIELGNAQNGQVDLGKYSLDNIEAVSLYNGQKSEIFQSAKEFGSAGSIYLQSRTPKFEQGKSTNFRVGLRVGSFDVFNPSILVEHKVTRTVSLSFNTEWMSSSGKYRFRYKRKTPAGDIAYDTTATRQNGDIDYMRFEGGLHGYLPRGRWKVFLYHYNSERGVPGAIVNNVWRRGERLWDRNSFVQGMFEQQLSTAWQTKINVKYAYDYTRYVNNDEKIQKVDNTYKQREVYLSWANQVTIFPWWEVSAAYDFQYNRLSDYMSVHRSTHWLSAATAVSLGRRFRAQASVLTTIVDEEKLQEKTAPDKCKVTPGVFLSYQPFRCNLVARAFFKKSYRMPTFNDLYYTDMGNAFLKPETATQYNGGLLYDLTRRSGALRFFRIGCDVYYNEVTDKIVAYPKGQQFRWTMLNLGKVHITGVDAQAQATFAIPGGVELTTKLQYTYQKAIDATSPADNYYRHQIPYIPWHSGSAIVMAVWRGWHLNYSFIYTGERYNQQENIIYNYTQPWYTHDLALMKEFTVGNTRLKATAEVNNLFSQDYDVILNYPMPKRNYRFGLTIDF
ncbi:MAG: TonB-dependent receptor [Bacteroidales bacterium]|nr:TonB-dependent receptor [Bacteroidales bacterium]